MMKYVRKILCLGKMTKLKYAVTQNAFREKHLSYLTLELKLTQRQKQLLISELNYIRNLSVQTDFLLYFYGRCNYFH